MENVPQGLTPAERRKFAEDQCAHYRRLSADHCQKFLGRGLTDDEQREMDERKKLMSDSDMLAALDQAEGISADMGYKAADQIISHHQIYQRRLQSHVRNILERKGLPTKPEKPARLLSVEAEIVVDKNRRAVNLSLIHI